MAPVIKSGRRSLKSAGARSTPRTLLLWYNVGKTITLLRQLLTRSSSEVYLLVRGELLPSERRNSAGEPVWRELKNQFNGEFGIDIDAALENFLDRTETPLPFLL